MNNTTFQVRRTQPFICVSLSALDTLIGDPPFVLLVYAHIIRRAGYNGTCWESIPHMAKYLRIATGSTKKALAILLDHGLISRESRLGATSIYRVAENNLVHNTAKSGHGARSTMLIGYEIWDDRADKPAGYATVNQTADGELVDIEVTHCTIPNSNPELWVTTAWRLCKQHNLAGVVFHHEASTVSISEITPF